MQKVNDALARLTGALDKLNAQQGGVAQVEKAHADLEIEAAHLRTDVSQVKKQKLDLESRQKKAAQEVDKALDEINAALGEN